MFKLFQRKKEDFKCNNCKLIVYGNGYTNHCPRCLYSLHVDVFPGDRAESCRGLMVPLRAVSDSGNYLIVHRCVSCRKTSRIKSHSQDNFEALISLC